MGDADDVRMAHFRPEPACARQARDFVSTTVAHWGFEDLTFLASLLVSELVANVVLHAGTDLDVVVRRNHQCVHLEVHDGDARLPTRKWYSTAAATGRGLALVEELSRRWGAETTATGKMVWCEIDASSGNPVFPSLEPRS